MDNQARENVLKPEYILVSIFTLVIAFTIRYVYKINRRIGSLTDLPRNYLDYEIKGIVTSVADGDGFKLFHTPLLRSTVYKPSDPKLTIRLAGIDAPETRWYGTPEQPYALESKEYLASLILNKRVKIIIKGLDRYNRILAIVFVGSCFSSVNVNLKIIEEGYACVYVGRDGVYGGYKDEMIKIQKIAKDKKKGMWKLNNLVLPMEYKKNRKKKGTPYN
ncbi:putative endonuclease LCL3 [Nosema granulosis]|uniref:Endonuclease LCL3 n=1 Tax=Nosema granulosis TaxID=83296 RepID=A0A9P6H1D8_9MICR|nr:putative endonuclease LCL3 [Nosema granulosis]